MAGVDMNPVETGLAKTPRSVAESLDRLPYFVFAGFHGLTSRDQVFNRRRCQRRDRGHAALTAGVAQFSKNDAAGIMNAFRKMLERLNSAVVVDRGMIVTAATALMDVHLTGKDETGATPGDVEVEVDIVLGDGAIGSRHRLRRRRPNEPVLDCERPDLSGLE